MQALVTAIDRALGTHTDRTALDERIAEADAAIARAYDETPDLRALVRNLELQFDEAQPEPAAGLPEEAAELAEGAGAADLMGDVEAFLRDQRERRASDGGAGGRGA